MIMKVKTEILTVKGAPLEGVSPLPSFRSRRSQSFKTTERFPEELKATLGSHTKVLPHLMQDRYSRKRLALKLKCLVLENGYLRAEFLPEYGGRLHRLYDKKAKKDLLFTNPVIQPGNLAIRNAWLSGGIEWNIGSVGHSCTTCDNVFAAILKDADGDEFIRIYEFERAKGIFWQIDFLLPEESRLLISHVKMINPFSYPTTTYWWSNIAVPDEGKTRVLASGKQVISFVGGKCDYETLPHIDAMPGVDVSYPSKATRSFDYFIQPSFPTESTWEAAAYEDGTVFFERSTAPLLYKKLFCWGDHHAGKHWQEFLSDGKGTGYYAEIQAGIAPSQLHDKLMPANGVYEWTQCFGGLSLKKEKLFGDHAQAVSYFADSLDENGVSAEYMQELDARLKKLAEKPVTADSIVHNGSGFGALEAIRMEADTDGTVPSSMCFPRSTLGSEQYPWLHLLENGTFPDSDATLPPLSYMISPKWTARIEKAAESKGDWFSLLQYGVARYEECDHTVLANAFFDGDAEKKQSDTARAAWLSSVKSTPNVWAYRNLAVLEKNEGNTEKAEQYYDLALALPCAFDDFALASEYLIFLAKAKKFEKLWDIFSSLPEACKKVDRIRISAAQAAVKLRMTDYLTEFFAEPHHDIREGECSLTDIWFEYCAIRMARERGLDANDLSVLDSLIDEAWDTCPPSEDIDFRMSFDKKNRYRVQ